MEFVYGLLMFGVAVMLLAGLIEGVLAVSKKPVWRSARFPVVMHRVVTVERRTQQMPYVGGDQRSSAAPQEDVRKAA